MRIGSRNGEAFFTGQLDDLRIFGRALAEPEIAGLHLEGYLPLVAKSRGVRTDEERGDLARFYKEFHAVDYLRAENALAQARTRKDVFYRDIPTTMIMEELDPPRETHVLTRGDFRNPGDRVFPGTPSFLPPPPSPASARLRRPSPPPHTWQRAFVSVGVAVKTKVCDAVREAEGKPELEGVRVRDTVPVVEGVRVGEGVGLGVALGDPVMDCE